MQLPIVCHSPQTQSENLCPELSQGQQIKLYYLAFLPSGFSPTLEFFCLVGFGWEVYACWVVCLFGLFFLFLIGQGKREI